MVGLSVSSRITGRKKFVENKEMVQAREALSTLGLLREIKPPRFISLKSFLSGEIKNIRIGKTWFFETL